MLLRWSEIKEKEILDRIETEKEIITDAKLAKKLGVKAAWLRSEADRGVFPHVRAEERYLFNPKTIQNIIIENAKCIKDNTGEPLRTRTIYFDDATEKRLTKYIDGVKDDSRFPEAIRESSIIRGLINKGLDIEEKKNGDKE